MRRLFFSILLTGLLASPVWADAFDDVERASAADDNYKYDEAIHYFTKALNSGELSLENQAITFYNRGRVHYRWGLYELALHDYNRALAINPNLAEAYGNRGKAHDMLEDHDRALRDWKHAYSLGNRPEWLVAKLKQYGEL